MSLIRFGQNTANATPAVNDLWLPVFGGEVVAAYDELNLFDKMITRRTITSGQTAKFPATWKMGSEIHEAGAELLGLQTELREYSISLDDRPVVSHFEVEDIDQMFAHFEVRAEFARQCGLALANRTDKRLAMALTLQSRVAQGNATSFPGGGIDGNGTAVVDGNLALPNATSATATNAQAVLTALDKIDVYWKQIDVVNTDRWCVVGPAVFNAIRKLGTVISGVTANPYPLMGTSIADPGNANPNIWQGMGFDQPLKYNGFNIVWSNHLPASNVTTEPANYAGDFSTSAGIVFTKDALAKVELMGIQTETFRDVRRQSDFFVAKMLMGAGGLRPYCAIELKQS